MESQNTANKHFCEKCNYGTDKKFNIEKHLLTKKHIKASTSDGSDEKVEKDYICQKCNKIYLSRNGLWCHSKKCGTKAKKEVINIEKLYELSLIIINQNKELKSQVGKIEKYITEINS